MLTLIPVTQYHGLSLYVSLRLISLYFNKNKGNLGWLPIINTKLSKNYWTRIKIKYFSIVGLMSPGWVRTQGLELGLWPTGPGLGLWSSGLGLGLWSNGLGLTPDGLGLWPDGLGLGLGLWPCGLGLTAGLMSPDSLQHCLPWYVNLSNFLKFFSKTIKKFIQCSNRWYFLQYDPLFSVCFSLTSVYIISLLRKFKGAMKRAVGALAKSLEVFFFLTCYYNPFASYAHPLSSETMPMCIK